MGFTNGNYRWRRLVLLLTWAGLFTVPGLLCGQGRMSAFSSGAAAVQGQPPFIRAKEAGDGARTAGTAAQDRAAPPPALLFHLSYAFQLPGGDLADRFGHSFSLGSGLEYLTASNWIAGLQGQYFFGSQVQMDVLSGLRTPEGFIYGNDKSVADIQLRQRGFYVGAVVGKLLSLSADNPRAGLRLTLSGGLLQHRIRIQDDPISGVPQLSGDYKRGYDRLSNGLSLQQFIGYQLLSPDGLVNFYAGIELTQAFTENRRPFNFDTRQAESDRRTDLLFGIRLGWILPFYLRKANEIYY